MIDTFTVEDTSIRLAAFLGVLLVMLAWERAAPRRPVLPGQARRRLHNLVLIAFGTLLLRLLPSLSSLAAAAVAGAHGFGLLWQLPLPLPVWAELAVAIVLLDLAVYLQHLVFHRVPLLWRLHRVHHSDREVDTTTGIRFHPLELLISMLYKAGIVLLTGAPLLAVMIFEILLNTSSLFNHGNVFIPSRVDDALRRLLVTPDMHRVHHSVLREETDSNYGFNLSVWDRLFGTYRAQPRGGHDAMRIGLDEFRDQDVVNVGRLLRQPLINVARTHASPTDLHQQGNQP